MWHSRGTCGLKRKREHHLTANSPPPPPHTHILPGTTLLPWASEPVSKPMASPEQSSEARGEGVAGEGTSP